MSEVSNPSPVHTNQGLFSVFFFLHTFRPYAIFSSTEAVPPANPAWEYQLRLNEFRIFKEGDSIEEMDDAAYVLVLANSLLLSIHFVSHIY